MTSEILDDNYFQGILLVDKPVGETSFSQVAKLRRLLAMKRIGHCGTLDPFASGLLPVCVGRATGAVQFMTDFDKAYRVGFRLGSKTNTMDLEGEIVESGDLDHWFSQNFPDLDLSTKPSEDLVKERLVPLLDEKIKLLTGEIDQVPPMFSAVKKAGKPLYYYARQGREVARKSRKVKIYEARLEAVHISFEPLTIDLVCRIACSKGTYIRTWVDSLGELLGTYAYARSLVRTKVGPLVLGDRQCDISQLFELFDQNNKDSMMIRQHISAAGLLLKLDEAFDHWPFLHLNRDQAQTVIHGQKLQACRPSGGDQSSPVRLLYQGDVLAFATCQPPSRGETVTYKSLRVFRNRV